MIAPAFPLLDAQNYQPSIGMILALSHPAKYLIQVNRQGNRFKSERVIEVKRNRPEQRDSVSVSSYLWRGLA